MEMTLSNYQERAKQKNKVMEDRAKWASVMLFGLMGEAGSLMTAAKKKLRDGSESPHYDATIEDEAGDTLWYVSSLCDYHGIKLSGIGAAICNQSTGRDHTTLDADHITFGHVQAAAKMLMLEKQQSIDEHLLQLGKAVGAIFSAPVSATGKNASLDLGILEDDLGVILLSIAAISDIRHLRLNTIANNNLAKIKSRWPDTQNEYHKLFDIDFPDHERFPTKLTFEFLQIGEGEASHVILRCNQLNIGDRITDNKNDPDYYRFHDVFHMSHVVFLGWSPVLRALLRLKRKSNPRFDRNEDGARAILIEEGITTWIFNYASRNDFLEKQNDIDFSTLKTVKEMVKGYEVENCAYWQWEIAIRKGYEVFRELKKHGRGFVTMDLEERSLIFSKERPNEH